MSCILDQVAVFCLKRLKVIHTVESMEKDPIAVVRIMLEAYQAAVFTRARLVLLLLRKDRKL